MRQRITLILLLACTSALGQATGGGPTEQQVRGVILGFEQGLAERNLAKIEPLVADDLVVFENGHRNDGWADFRDHHLIPEMKEPAPPSKSEIIRITAMPQMAWGYTKTTMTLTRKTGEKSEALLWSVYVLENRSGDWKIVLLDWSIAVRPAKK